MNCGPQGQFPGPNMACADLETDNHQHFRWVGCLHEDHEAVPQGSEAHWCYPSRSKAQRRNALREHPWLVPWNCRLHFPLQVPAEQCAAGISWPNAAAASLMVDPTAPKISKDQSVWPQSMQQRMGWNRGYQCSIPLVCFTCPILQILKTLTGSGGWTQTI